MYCKEIRCDLRADCKYCHNMLYPPQFLHNHKAKVLHKWLQQIEVDIVQNRNTSRCAEAVNESELIRSTIRDYLADH